MTGKHREQSEIPLLRAQVLGEDGKVVSKRKCPVLERTLAGTELEGPRQLHLEIQETTLDGFLLADRTISSKQGGAFYFQDDIGVNLETTSQVTARQEVARLSMSQQQRGVIKPGSKENKQFNPGG